jgi:hypothetical protein
MQLSRLVAGAVAFAVALGIVASLPVAARQSSLRLSKPQQATLEAVVTAVDRAATDAALVTRSTWQAHVLRSSDGSHYIALRGRAPGLIGPKDPVMLYVRLADRGPAPSTPPRSAVLEWLRGERAEPLPMRARRAMNVPAGEMPVGGAASILGSRPDLALENTSALRLMDRERQRDAREREEADAKRRAALENAKRGSASSMHPFEDFDIATALEGDPAGVTVLRSVRAGPGDYVLTVAWAEPGPPNRPPAVRVITHPLTLPAATPDFGLSDIVLADGVRTLDAAYPVDRQNAHPYAIGALEATPAGDEVFRVDERLSVVFQVINPTGAATGKPDVEVSFKVTRTVGEREQDVGILPPQRYSAATLPVDFDVAKGHPVFPAVQASLAKFVRGRYRLEVTALDQLTGQRATRDVRFEVAGTPHSLLNEAPAPGQAFRRENVVTAPMLAVIAQALRPATPSDWLTKLLDAAAAGRFADLLREAPVAPTERSVAQALRGLGLFGLGDAPRTVAVQLQQALAQGAPAPPVLLVLGATSALNGDDKAAITAWNQARDGGVDEASVATLLVDAYVRQGDVARAMAMARAALDAQPGSIAAARGLAAASIAAGKYAEALAVLDAVTTAVPDTDTDFLVAHALYGGFVGQTAPGATPTGRERLQAVGQRYIDAGGRHAALMKEWLAVVSARAAAP